MKIKTLPLFFAMSFIAILFLASTAFVRHTDKPDDRLPSAIKVPCRKFSYSAAQRVCKQDTEFHTVTVFRFSLSAYDPSRFQTHGNNIHLKIEYKDFVYGDSTLPIHKPKIEVPFFFCKDNSLIVNPQGFTKLTSKFNDKYKRKKCSGFYKVFELSIDVTQIIEYINPQATEIEGGLAIVLITQDPITCGNLSPTPKALSLTIDGKPLTATFDDSAIAKTNFPPCYQDLGDSLSAKPCECQCPNPSESWFQGDKSDPFPGAPKQISNKRLD